MRCRERGSEARRGQWASGCGCSSARARHSTGGPCSQQGLDALEIVACVAGVGPLSMTGPYVPVGVMFTSKIDFNFRYSRERALQNLANVDKMFCENFNEISHLQRGQARGPSQVAWPRPPERPPGDEARRLRRLAGGQRQAGLWGWSASTTSNTEER